MKHTVNPFIKYPLYPQPGPLLERWMVKLGYGFIKCLVCGSWTLVHSIRSENLRETGICNTCHATNRQRQMAYTLLHAVRPWTRQPIQTLADFRKLRNITLYNTEANGPLHDVLSHMPGYQSSFYFGPDYRSGELVNGVMHQDLMQLSFEDNSLDLVISSDVFEHVADPYLGHREVHRVLKQGGKHIFTVPFDQLSAADDVRATLEDGELVYLKDPIFHGDPVSLRPEGVLVFTIFSVEMLARLEAIGFRTHMLLLRVPRCGIFGPNALTFEAIKL